MMHNCIQFDGENVNIIGTNSNFLYLSKEPCKIKAVEYIVNTSFSRAAKSFTDATFGGADNFIMLSNENMKIIYQVEEGRYPNYKVVMPHDYEHNCFIPREELLQAINSITLYETKFPQIIFTFIPGVVKINFDDADFDKHVETEIECKHSVEFEQIKFNAKFLKTIIASLPEKEDVKIYLSGPNKAAMFDADNEKYLLQPLILQP